MKRPENVLCQVVIGSTDELSKALNVLFKPYHAHFTKTIQTCLLHTSSLLYPMKSRLRQSGGKTPQV